MPEPDIFVSVFLIALVTFVDLSFVFMFLDDMGFQTAWVCAAPVTVWTIVLLYCFGVRMCLGNVGPHICHPIEHFIAKWTSVNGCNNLNIVDLVIYGSKQSLVTIVIIGFLLLDCDPGGHS